jgi:hypothetical protein
VYSGFPFYLAGATVVAQALLEIFAFAHDPAATLALTRLVLDLLEDGAVYVAVFLCLPFPVIESHCFSPEKN